MVLLIQLAIFIAIYWYRRRWLLGKHLRKGEAGEPPYYAQTRSKGRTTLLHIGIDSEKGFPFAIKRERWGHRLLKKVGLAHEVQANDRHLDKKLYFTTDYPNHLSTLLKSSENLATIKELFKTDVKAIYGAAGKIWMVMSDKVENRDLHQFSDQVEKLKKLGDAIAQASHIPYSQNERQVTWLAWIFIAAHLALFSTAIGGWIGIAIDSNAVVMRGEFLKYGLFYGGIAISVWLAAILFLFSRTSWIGWVLADFLFYGWVGLLICSAYIVRDVNIMADRTQALIQTMPVQSKDCTLVCKKTTGSGKHRRTTTHEYPLNIYQCEPTARGQAMLHYQKQDYVCRSQMYFNFYINTSSWRPDMEAYRYSTFEQEFDRISRGDPIDIPTHPGALGIEWVETDKIQRTRH